MTVPCHRTLLPLLSLLLLAVPLEAEAPAAGPPPLRQTARIDLSAPAREFPHFWEQVFGSGRAILTLRESYRRDLDAVRAVTGLTHVRPHGIFLDEVGLYGEDAKGRPVYNFSYVDQIYDGLLEHGVRPFVELSFMPRQLAVRHVLHPFWYKQLTAPPKSWRRWGELVEAFTRHLVERYGVEEVRQWYFEVWNEPNIDFWSGEPKEPTYYRLYEAAARAVKRVDPRLRVGGPATAQAAWVDRFIAHCVRKRLPVDFVSTHVYANDTSRDVLRTDEPISRERMVARAVRKVHDQVKASARPSLPIFFSEYNASYCNELPVTDSPFMGPWLATTIRQCDGLDTTLAFWTFSDVFEEQGVVKKPFYGGFGLLAAGGIPKAAFNAFALLHRLGERRLDTGPENTLVTRTAGGRVALAAWSYAAHDETGRPRELSLLLQGLTADCTAVVHRVGPSSGNALATWRRMGEPAFPTREQQRALREAATLAPPERVPLRASHPRLVLDLQPHELALVEFE